MKNFRFYLEYETTTLKNKATRKALGYHMGTVCAVLLGTSPSSELLEGFGGIYEYGNCPVVWSAISREYIEKYCKRISEKQAREIHPDLFKRLDELNETSFT